MNFQPQLARLVVAGEKTVTRRIANDNPRSPWFVDRCGLVVGRDYAVCPGRGKRQLGRVRIIDVCKMPLWPLSEREAQREGFVSVQSFRWAWETINGDHSHNPIVWRVEMERLVA